MTGNTLGRRGSYRYLDDTETEYAIVTDTDIAAAGEFPVATAGLPSLPRRSRMRYVLATAVDDPLVRKRIWCASPASNLYDAPGSTTFTLDGRQFVTTGRVGERFSYPPVAPATPP